MAYTNTDILNYKEEYLPIKEQDYTKANLPAVLVKYRGCIIPIYWNTKGQEYYCEIAASYHGFGILNVNFIDRLKKLIDDQLDTVKLFTLTLQSNSQAKLEYFNNNGYRDLRLSYNGRTLKVFLLPSLDYELTKDEFTEITNCCEEALKKFLQKSKG